ncbi:MAG: response regulator [Bacillota bacterium]
MRQGAVSVKPVPVNELVLIVEDEDPLVKGLSLSLKQAGYRVISAGDGLEGLRMALEQAPDLVIPDVASSGADHGSSNPGGNMGQLLSRLPDHASSARPASGRR